MYYYGRHKSNRNSTYESIRILVATLIFLGLTAPFAAAGDSSTALSASSDSTVYTEQARFTATVSGYRPSGDVTFKKGTKALGSATLGAASGDDAPQNFFSAGEYHTCALTAEGTAQCWGQNQNGQLGVVGPASSSVPVDVPGLAGDLAMIVGGSDISCAVTDAGALKCWGHNNRGQLGDGSTDDSTTPVSVEGLTSGVVSVDSDGGHTCALTDAGAVQCWGFNNDGQLGDGTEDDSSTPVDVEGLGSGVTAISVGEYHSCALTGSGGVKCWGENYFGQLGDGTTDDSMTPVDVDGLDSDAVAVAAARYHACALTDTNIVQCWGRNLYGQLGDGTTDDTETPVTVQNLDGDIIAISTSRFHTCALTDDGGVQCWGDNNNGQLGDGTTDDSVTPVSVTGLDGTVVAISTGERHTCALTDEAVLQCWGSNFAGQLGDGTEDNSSTPVSVAGLAAMLPEMEAQATFKTRDLSVGTLTITATYEGDDVNAESTSEDLTVTVERGSPKIKQIQVKPNKPTVGDTLRLKVKVRSYAPSNGKPSGKLVVYDGKEKLGKYKVNDGKASFKVKGLDQGKHKLKLKFNGNSKWSPKSEKVTVRIKA